MDYYDRITPICLANRLSLQNNIELKIIDALIASYIKLKQPFEEYELRQSVYEIVTSQTVLKSVQSGNIEREPLRRAHMESYKTRSKIDRILRKVPPTDMYECILLF